MNYKDMTKAQLIRRINSLNGDVDMYVRLLEEEQGFSNLMESGSDFYERVAEQNEKEAGQNKKEAKHHEERAGLYRKLADKHMERSEVLYGNQRKGVNLINTTKKQRATNWPRWIKDFSLPAIEEALRKNPSEAAARKIAIKATLSQIKDECGWDCDYNTARKKLNEYLKQN